MPYARFNRLRTRRLAWQELRLLEYRPGWSQAYQVASPRLMWPQGPGFVRVQILSDPGMPCDELVVDRACALWLTPKVRYRIAHAAVPGVLDLISFNDATLNNRHTSLLHSPAGLRHITPVDELGWRAAARMAGASRRPICDEPMLGFLERSREVPATGGHLSACAREAVERARDHLRSAPTCSDDLPTIARLIGVSPFHLARAFRAATGFTLHAYRTRLRMGLALDALARDDGADFSQLALDLGYAHHSHFSSVFRRAYGMSPRVARARLQAC